MHLIIITKALLFSSMNFLKISKDILFLLHMYANEKQIEWLLKLGDPNKVPHIVHRCV